MRRALAPLALALLGFVVLPACSSETDGTDGEDSAAKPTPARSDASDDAPGEIHIPVAGGGGGMSGGGGGGSGGGGGASSSADAGQDGASGGTTTSDDTGPRRIEAELHLVCRARESEVGRGEPILVELEVQNKGTASTYLVEPGFDLRQNLLLSYREAGEWRTIGRRQRWTEETAPRKVLLEPGQRVVVVVDLLPLLEPTLAYDEGKVRFRVLYDGGADLLEEVDGAIWNPTGRDTIQSDEIDIDVASPDWMEAFDLDEDAVAEVEVLLQELRSTSDPRFEERVEAIRELGEPGMTALAFVLEALDSRQPHRARTGGIALAAMRALGADGLAALKRVEAYPHPVRDMARGVLTEDLRVETGQGLGPAAAVAKALGSGASGASLLLEFSAGELYPTGRRYVLTASGVLEVVESPGTEGESDLLVQQLTTEELVAIKKAALDARIWHLKPVRRQPRAGEGWAFMALSHGGQQTMMTRLHGAEAATENPLSAAVHDALRSHAERAVRTLQRRQ